MKKRTYKRCIFTDIETFSDIELGKCGVYKYSESDEFRILLCAYAFDNEPVRIVDLASGATLPQEYIDALTDPEILKTAHNAAFERVCLSRYLSDKELLPQGIFLDPAQWECTMVHSAMLGYPFSLNGVAQALKTGEQKDKAGEDLIKYFCVPCKATKSNGGRIRNLPEYAPEKWEAFKSYCIQDVATERDVFHRLEFLPIPEKEHQIYVLDQRINDRGILIDMDLVDQAIKCDLIYSDLLINRAYELTELDNPNSVSQLKQWLESKGLEVCSLGKKDVAAQIKELGKNCCDEELLEMLKLRQQMAKSSVKKYQAAERAVSRDYRARGLFQYGGAARTLRWAGRRIQLQNLPQNHISTLDEARYLVRIGAFDALETIYGNTPDILSQLIRTMLIPRYGYEFIVADFSAIEARVLAWLAGEKWRLESFGAGEDIYCSSAAKMFGVPVVKNGINGELRAKGKVAELACGYNGAAGALIAMGALDMGLKESDLPDIISSWRESNPHIVQLWRDVERAAIETVKNGTTTRVGRLMFERFAGELFITLPSGRRLAYVSPRLELNRFGRMSVTFMGIGTNNKWQRQETYGGKIIENCLSGDTLVITHRGFVPLRSVADNDYIWDGEELVQHEGLQYKGIQETVSVNGLRMTPDHKIFSEKGWMPCGKAQGLDWAEVSLPRVKRNNYALSFRKQLADRIAVHSTGYKECVYDIRNCGPRHRFAVWDKGSGKARIVSNCTQATARDLLAEAMLRVDTAGYDIVAHVHDEVIVEVPKGSLTVESLCELMSVNPQWADGLPLDADGYVCPGYYRKS